MNLVGKVGASVCLVTLGAVVGAAAVVAGDSETTQVTAGSRNDPGSMLMEGAVTFDRSVAELATIVPRGTEQTQNGAVAAFTSYAVWLVGSPAAENDPSKAVRKLGKDRIHPADAQLLTSMHRTANTQFAAASGAYRIVGFNGPSDKPDHVLVEVAAPLTIDGSTRWVVVGGVVVWVDGSWQLYSMQPREIPQPDGAALDITSLSDDDQSRVLDGIGWHTYDFDRGGDA